MSDDRAGGTEPTLTPSQVMGSAATVGESAGQAASTPTLPARYVLGQRLGAGGMGEVLLANDQQLGRDVAIKRMLHEGSPAAVARFLREAKVQGRLDHPAIVPVYELGNDAEGRPFFVMKRLAGTTLSTLLARRTLGRHKLLRAFADVCLAIEFAHRRGVVHRDLKPDNIMLGDFGEVYVLDWGIAHLGGDDALTGDDEVVDAGGTEAGAILGTPGYLAPEQLRGEPIDGRADVFSLGCVLFELLAGESMLPRGRAALAAALEAYDARPSVIAPGENVPPELDALCVLATDRDPAARPTAGELAERIERFLDGDRDLALRTQLAAEHLAAARAALESGDGETARRTAMREAGRAIALDPRDRGAAELVGRLMLAPPREVPRDVDQRVEALHDAAARNKLRIAARAVAVYFLLVPVTLVLGVRSVPALVALAIVIAANVGLTAYLAGRTAPATPMDAYLAAALSATLIGMIAHYFTPFLAAPGIAAVSVMIFVVEPRLRWEVIAALHVAAVLGPWLLELAGVCSRTISVVGGDLVLRSPLTEFSLPAGEIALAVYALAMVGLAGMIGARVAATQREAMRSIELQAWHLRQLVER